MREVRAAGRRLEALYAPGADPDAPVLVFLHEGLGSVAMWKCFPQELAARTGCGLLAYSRYGNGFSEVLAQAREPGYMHDEARLVLPQVLDAFGVRDAILIGHSDGASIALIYAGEIGSRVRAVIAEAPHVFVEDISVASIARAKEAYESTDLAVRLGRYHADVRKTFYGWNDIWLHPAFRDWNIREQVRGIRVPVLLIQGSDDEYGTPAQLQAIRSDVHAAPVDTLFVSRCGHSPHRDRSELVAACAAAFIKEASG